MAGFLIPFAFPNLEIGSSNHSIKEKFFSFLKVNYFTNIINMEVYRLKKKNQKILVAPIGPLAWETPYAAGAALQNEINK